MYYFNKQCQDNDDGADNNFALKQYEYAVIRLTRVIFLFIG